MEVLKDLAVSLCCLMIVCQIIFMLSPKGSFGKIFKYIVGLFLIAGLFSQTKNLGLKLSKVNLFKEEITRQERLEEEISKEILKINENYVYKIGTDNINVIVKTSLKEIDVTPKQIIAEIEKSEDDDKYKPRLVISLSKDYEPKEKLIKSKIKKDTGEEPTLYFEESKQEE